MEIGAKHKLMTMLKAFMRLHLTQRSYWHELLSDECAMPESDAVCVAGISFKSNQQGEEEFERRDSTSN